MLPTFSEEMNWSGRGQHAEYLKEEEEYIPLVVEQFLGTSATAIVQSVLCKRIRLARKTIRCNRRLKREEVIKEVEVLQKLSHSHIVRAVGTYVLNNTLSILLYPATEYNLENFMDEEICDDLDRSLYLRRFFDCLASSLGYLHRQAIKHMDIKPRNLLVKRVPAYSILHSGSLSNYKIYIADFGISRSYSSIAEAETDSFTSFTRKYSAPEVVLQDIRGLSADVFSLGCVYVEMVAAILSKTSELENHLAIDTSYQANVPQIQGWLRTECLDACSLVDEFQISQMLDLNPLQRPKMRDICENIKPSTCCLQGQDLFEDAT
jgi:serine/threonine protein kinase